MFDGCDGDECGDAMSRWVASPSRADSGSFKAVSNVNKAVGNVASIVAKLPWSILSDIRVIFPSSCKASWVDLLSVSLYNSVTVFRAESMDLVIISNEDVIICCEARVDAEDDVTTCVSVLVASSIDV